MSWAPKPESSRHALSKGGKTLSPSMESALGAKHRSQEGAHGAESAPWLSSCSVRLHLQTRPGAQVLTPLVLARHVERRRSWRPCTGCSPQHSWGLLLPTPRAVRCRCRSSAAALATALPRLLCSQRGAARRRPRGEQLPSLEIQNQGVLRTKRCRARRTSRRNLENAAGLVGFVDFWQ